MKKIIKWLAIFLAIGAAMTYGVPLVAGALSGVFGLLLLIAFGWVLLKLIDLIPSRGSKPKAAKAGRPRRTSFRHRTAVNMTDTVMGGLSGILDPKGPSSEDERRFQERKKAKQDYAFHSYQAKKYAGTSDGAWHAQRAKEARWKMK